MSELYITGTTKCADKYKALIKCIESGCTIDESIEIQSKNNTVKSYKISASINTRSSDNNEFFDEVKRVRKSILDHQDPNELIVEVTLME